MKNDIRPVTESSLDFERLSYLKKLYEAIPRVIKRLNTNLTSDERELNENIDNLYNVLSKESKKEIVEHPLFCYWWINLMNKYKNDDDYKEWFKYLANFMIFYFIKEGINSKSKFILVVNEGELWIPGYKGHFILPNYNKETCEVILKNNTFIINNEYHISYEDVLKKNHPFIKNHPIINNQIEMDALHPWYSKLFKSINDRNDDPAFNPTDLEVLYPVSVDKIRNMEQSSLYLKKIWPQMFKEMQRYVQNIVPYTSKISSTFTDSAFMGAIFMSESKYSFDNHIFTAEHLLHEASHLRLTLIIGCDPLFIPKDENEKHYSPLRKDERPLIGIIQGAYVFSRIAIFLNKVLEKDVSLNQQVYIKRLIEVNSQLGELLNSLVKGANFTGRGQKLVDDMTTIYQETEEYLRELISERV